MAIDKKFFESRPLSWSAISSFEYDPEGWYKKYVLGEKPPENKEMIFGKRFANAIENAKKADPKSEVVEVFVGNQKALVPVLEAVEHPFKIVFGDIPLIGFADSYCTVTNKKFKEFKTGKNEWTQEKANNHGQILMYLLMNFVTYKIDPEEVEFELVWYPTQEHGDFTISFIEPIEPKMFRVKHTLADVIEFGARINSTINQMIEYVNKKEKEIAVQIPQRTA